MLYFAHSVHVELHRLLQYSLGPIASYRWLHQTSRPTSIKRKYLSTQVMLFNILHTYMQQIGQ